MGDGNTVTIKKLTYGENTECNSKAYRADGTFDVFRHNLARMQASVTEWSGEGFEGQVVSYENIGKLPLEVVRKINDAIATLNKDVGEDEGNASGAATN
ncbi:MAG: hypothetical protein ACOYD4_06880 [Solirubrobacterales bacterium]